MTSDQEGKAPHDYHPENIAGKAAIVTGGTTGIGRATAQMLAECGARVLIYGRDENDLQKALSELQACGEVHGLNADQSKLEDVRRVFAEADARLGGVDILVNNAAISSGSILEKSLEEIRYGLEVNILGYMACAKEAIARMKSSGGGHIVNIGSMSAEVREEESDIYVATKAAIQAFSVSLRKTANAQGVKVSLIEPGLVATDMTQSSPAEQQEKQRKGEMLEASDIAECVHYILTQPARCDVVMVQIRPHLQSI
jgi:NADP-dependent 3-hydroxy acid dehydrogenase YdfG